LQPQKKNAKAIVLFFQSFQSDTSRSQKINVEHAD